MPEFLSVGSIIFLPLLLDFYFISCLKCSNSIATFGVVGNICQFIFRIPESIGIATLILVGRESGRKNLTGANQVLSSLLGLCFFWGLVQFFIICFFSKKIVALAGITDSFLDQGANLLKLHSVSSLISGLFFVFAGFFKGLKNTFYPGIINFLSTFVFLFFDYALVFGNFGMPRLEIFASPVAFIIKYFFSGFILLALFFYKFRLSVFDFVSFLSFEKTISGVLNSGPIILDKLVLASTYIFLYKIASGSGGLIPIIEILKNVMLVFFAPSVAMSLVATILVSNFSGAGLNNLALRSVKVIFALIFFWCLASSFFVFCFSQNLVSAFCCPGLLVDANFFLKVSFPLIFFDCMQSFAAGACRGLGLVWHIFVVRVLSVLIIFYPTIFAIQNFYVGSVAIKAFMCFITLYATFGIIALLLFLIFFKKMKNNSPG